jgi:hypothetical protein
MMVSLTRKPIKYEGYGEEGNSRDLRKKKDGTKK